MMYNFFSLALLVLALEITRRCCLMLLKAFTGPLAKVPGPFIAKFTYVPWVYQSIRGEQMHAVPELIRKYGDIVRITPNDVVVADKSAITKILQEIDFRKSPDYDNFIDSAGAPNLFTETDKVKYKAMRRLLSPGFSISYLNGLEPLFVECVQEFVKFLDAKCDSGDFVTVDFNQLLSNLTSDVIAATAFGGSFDLVKTGDRTQKDVISTYLINSIRNSAFQFIKYVPFFTPIEADMEKMVATLITRRRIELEQGVKKNDLLQLLLDANAADPRGFTDYHVTSTLMLFMIAGSDTTSMTATFTILLLVNNPEALRKLIAEIDKAYPTLNDTIDFATTQELPYLNAVINESMRTMSIVQVGLGRLITETTVFCNYELPKGTTVYAWLSSVHLDPKIWPDADSFVPERWLAEYKGATIDRKAFLPFSIGSRNCIGQQFALRELRLILVTLLRRFKLRLVQGQSHELKFHVVPWFTQGFYNVDVRKRTS